MKVFITLFLLFSTFFAVSQDNTNKIRGVVSDMGYPLANVNIAIKGSSEGIQTDANGKYEIEARPRDVLVFSYIGMYSQEVIVEDVTRVLNINMKPRVEELDEVIVQQEGPKGQQGMAMNYGTKKTIIRTAYGFVDAENAGYSMNFVDGTELNPSAIDIIAALQGKLPGLTIGTSNGPNGGSSRALYMRGRGSANNPRPVIFEVDGVIFESVPDFLDIQTVDRVATIPGLAGVTRYGQIAAGGVVVINTKGANVVREEGTNKPYDQAKLRNNIYNERVGASKLKRKPPKYILAISDAPDYESAQTAYQEQKIIYGTSAYFFIESSNIFLEKWKNEAKSTEILNEMKQAFSNNPNALKALAYTLEEHGKLKEALDVYMEIFKKRSRYAQSYRDLANMYAENGEYKKALGIHARYQQLRKMDTISIALDGIDGILETESTNLLARKGEELAISNSDISDADVGGTRVLFEWNNSEAEFDLQFVNPENQYFIWSHTLENEPEQLKDEKVKGYTCEQFLIDRSLPGVWKINVKYFGNKGYDPTYIKATVYYDYGLPSQNKVMTVMPLTEKNINRELLTLVTKIIAGGK